MIGVLEFLALFVYGVWKIRRATQRRQATTSNPGAPRRALATGLEDAPVHWPATQATWTALDERQLVRLLKDAAPRHTPTTNSTDTTEPTCRPKDTP